jgi:putative peptidoglycan lipid II flippase
MSSEPQNLEIYPEQIKPDRHEKGIAIATFLVIVGLILSKTTGFLREMLVSGLFPEKLQEAFSMAFYIPDFVYNLLVGGAIQASITPSLARSIQKNDESKGIASVSIFVSIAAVVMGIAVILGILFTDKVYPLIYSNSKTMETVMIAANASKILFPQVFFMMLAAFSIGILNAYKKFSATAIGPTVYNVFVVLSILLFAGYSSTSFYWTTAGIMAAALIYFLFQAFVGRKYLRKFHFSLDIKNKGFQNLFRLAIPILISSSIIQMNAIILSAFANTFPEEIQFPLRNAFTLWQLPYGIFAVAVGSVMLPSLAGHFAVEKFERAQELFSGSLKNALFMTIPMAGLLALLPEDIVSTVFSLNGNYATERVKMAGYLLLGYSAAVIIHTVVFIYNQAFYAIGKTKVPFVSGLINMTVLLLSCTLLIKLNNNPEPIYLTLSYSAAALVSAVFLILYFSKNKKLQPTGMGKFVLKAAICLLILAASVWGVNQINYTPDNKLTEILWLGARGVVGMTAYITAAALLKMPELLNFTSKFRVKMTGMVGKK